MSGFLPLYKFTGTKPFQKEGLNKVSLSCEIWTIELNVSPPPRHFYEKLLCHFSGGNILYVSFKEGTLSSVGYETYINI